MAIFSICAIVIWRRLWYVDGVESGILKDCILNLIETMDYLYQQRAIGYVFVMMVLVCVSLWATTLVAHAGSCIHGYEDAKGDWHSWYEVYKITQVGGMI